MTIILLCCLVIFLFYVKNDIHFILTIRQTTMLLYALHKLASNSPNISLTVHPYCEAMLSSLYNYRIAYDMLYKLITMVQIWNVGVTLTLLLYPPTVVPLTAMLTVTALLNAGGFVVLFASIHHKRVIQSLYIFYMMEIEPTTSKALAINNKVNKTIT